MANNTNKYLNLPVSRVKVIMKSSPQVENISNESIYLVAKATYLAQESLMYGQNVNELKYESIAHIVNNESKFEFLKGLLQFKVYCQFVYK
ncbi:Chromatin accessibility complex protein, putative [Pediculus humanus corporis]|uniref:Chromatin accessibility complex protein, putative n=1 Tax=Pediculus humanus subsp. corporis TaxID=121224 RepID=E0VUU2_PEDHC|nr:Chromatin accessibility complex protein, putative [Pediculus humanus corporis]EEB17148.1 Chromatin accessibility complex protein, putative [Pediculus humanus corporis]